MNAEEIMTIEEVAKYLKLTPQTVYKWAQEEQIPGTKLGKEWRFRKGILDEWVDSSIILSKGGFDLVFRSSLLASRNKALSNEETDQLLKEAMD
ncbi:MAG: helix-turn-helix domain-containing protein [Verrucomicrobia bacterium]|nr:helix-turn-helix domain-containing protein [Verrucomicrobiota bacterium]